jgi:inhibitor of cysteine peptidase
MSRSTEGSMTGKSFTPLRNTLIPILGILGMLLLAGGCARPVVGGSSSEPPSEGPMIANLRSYRLEMKQGQVVEVRLPSNPSTGYRWVMVEPMPSVVAALDDARYVPGRTDVVGSTGEERWALLAVKPGSGIMRFEYRRPFDADTVAPAQRASYLFEVR